MPQVLKSALTGEVESCETKNGNDIIKTVSGEGPNEEVYHYATAGVVGNGSFGVVFQATCLETTETVRRYCRIAVQCSHALWGAPTMRRQFEEFRPWTREGLDALAPRILNKWFLHLCSKALSCRRVI